MTAHPDRSRWPKGAIGVRPHDLQPSRLRRIPWLVCRHCGLVSLRNEATRKALRVGCYRWADEP